MMRHGWLLFVLLGSLPAFSQNLSGKWLAYEGSDGADLVVSLQQTGVGQATLSLVRRMQAVSYGEGSQFWGTFRATGGYYYLVKGLKSEQIRLTQTDSTVVITRRTEPKVSVSAWLDEAYSTRDLSDYGGYKKQVLAQWKRDFSRNEDVKKGKLIMQRYFVEYYGDAFEELLEGRYQIVERTGTSIKLKNLDLDTPIVTWRKLSE